MTTHDEMLLRSMTALVSSHGKAISRFGASVVVMSKFAEAVLPQLTTTQIECTIEAFRALIGDALDVADETGHAALPGDYRATLLEQSNVLLNRLGDSAAAPR
ncbi:hypothetical protein [Paraburkholderia sp. J67]|uniref:hypothetical protein n=1 Tax=Paraburkholderia sp. J67 TaxID=2805435 RepID=UPI002ABD2953|nr:hypothetical protein [Paraburkholderia sp. J67]